MTEARASQSRLRRRYPRLTLRVEVVIETAGTCTTGVATTLGAGGLFVSTPAPLPLGAPLGVRFCLPGDREELRFQAHVVWSQTAESGGSPGMGIEFHDADARAELAARLERWTDLRGVDPRSGAGRA